LDSEALAYKFLDTAKKLDEAAKGFASPSSQGALNSVMHVSMGFTTDTSAFKQRDRQFQSIFFRSLSNIWNKGLHVNTNVGFLMLLFLHQEEQMTLQH